MMQTILISNVLSTHADNASDRLPFQHVVKCFVDLRERDRVSNKFLQFQLLQNQLTVLLSKYNTELGLACYVKVTITS